jgi:hypothetical protein
MKQSKKNDEGLLNVSTRLDALLVGGNSSKEHASYIDECSGKQIHYGE